MTTQYPDYLDIIPYQVTEEAQEDGIPEEAQELLEEVHPYLHNPNRALVKELEAAVKRYPQIPQFQSHLSMVYILLGKTLKARRVVTAMQQKFPDYLYSKLRGLELESSKKRGPLMRTLLGDGLWLHDLYPEKECFHVTEVISFYTMVARQLLEEGDVEAAVARHKVMIIVDPEGKYTRLIALEVVSALMERKSADMVEEEGLIIEPENFNKVAEKYPPTEEPPQFRTHLMKVLYVYGTEELPDSIVQELMALPKEELANDLQLVVADTIRRHQYFIKGMELEEEIALQQLEHALMLAAMRELQGLIPVFLDFLRAGQDIVEFWLDVDVLDYSYHFLRIGFPEYADVYAKFVREENVYGQGKAAIVIAVAGAALHEPKLKEQAVQWILHFLENHLAEADNDSLFDTQLLNMGMQAGIWLQDERFEPWLAQVYESEWRLPYILEDHDHLLAQLRNEKKLDIPPALLNKPETLMNFFEQGELPDDDEMLDMVGTTFGITVEDPICRDYYNRIMLEGMSDLMHEEEGLYDDEDDDYFFDDPDDMPSLRPPSSPVKSQKIGRNQPCPCGSGKKYKHCCGRK